MSSALNLHLKEVEKEKQLTREEEKKLTLQVMLGNQEAREKLIKANMRYVISKAFEYADQGIPVEDLIQEGYIGLCKAVDRYDPLKEFKFITFASWWIWQSIIQFITNHSGTVRLPANKVSELRKIKKAEDKLSRELGRTPTLIELEEELPDLDVTHLMPWLNTSYNKHQHEDEESENRTEQDEIDALAKASGIPFPEPDNDMVAQGTIQEISKSIDKLTEREAKIIRLYYGVGDMTPLTLEEIGELFDLTRERIRQIKITALKKLEEMGGLKDALS